MNVNFKHFRLPKFPDYNFRRLLKVSDVFCYVTVPEFNGRLPKISDSNILKAVKKPAAKSLGCN